MIFLIIVLILIGCFTLTITIIGFANDHPDVGVVFLFLTFIFGMILVGLSTSDGESDDDKVIEIDVVKNNGTQSKLIIPQTYIDSIYESGYKRGQIDCQKDSLVWVKIMNNDGEVIYQNIK
jgi:hypothetical protein